MNNYIYLVKDTTENVVVATISVKGLEQECPDHVAAQKAQQILRAKTDDERFSYAGAFRFGRYRGKLVQIH